MAQGIDLQGRTNSYKSHVIVSSCALRRIQTKLLHRRAGLIRVALWHKCNLACINAVHLRKLREGLAAFLKCAAQRLLSGQPLSVLGEGFFQQAIDRRVFAHNSAKVLRARKTRYFKRFCQLRFQLRAQVLGRTGLPPTKEFDQCLMDVLGGQITGARSFQIIPLTPGCNTLKIACRTCVYTQRSLQRGAIEMFWMTCQQFMKDSQLQRKKPGTEQSWIELEQLLQHIADFWRRS